MAQKLAERAKTARGKKRPSAPADWRRPARAVIDKRRAEVAELVERVRRVVFENNMDPKIITTDFENLALWAATLPRIQLQRLDYLLDARVESHPKLRPEDKKAWQDYAQNRPGEAAELEKIAEGIKSLLPIETMRFELVIAPWLAPKVPLSPEELDRQMVRDGFLERIPRKFSDAERAELDSFEPIEIEGEPVSEQVMRERR